MNLPPTHKPIRFSRQPVLFLAVAFSAGIVAAAYLDLHFAFAGVIAAACSVGAFIVRGRPFAGYCLIGAFLFIGAFSYQFEIRSMPEHRIKRIYDEGQIASGTPVEIEGILSGRPEPAHNGAIIRVRADKLIQKGEKTPASGFIRIFVPLGEPEQIADLESLKLSSGVRIRTACELMREDQFLNPGVIPRRTILDQQGIDATCTVKSPLLIDVVERPLIAGPLDIVYEQRQWLIDEFRERLSPQAAGVMIASLLGDKYFLDKETADIFRDGGTFHVLVISGLHITYIGGILLWLVGRFTRDRRMHLVIAGTTLWLYTLAVGAEVPVVRASVMFTSYLFARSIYRDPRLLNTLGLCCLLLLAWRPADLFNPSFQLTVVSVAAIVGMAFPLIEKLRAIGSWMPEAANPFPPSVPEWLRRFCETLYWRPHIWDIEQNRQVWSARIFKRPYLGDRLSDGLRRAAAYIFEGLLVSLIVQVWMLPLSIYYFHRVSPISVFLNLWVGVVIAVESFAGILTMLFALVSDSLSMPFAAITDFLNWTLVSVPGLFVDLDWASFRVPIYSGPMRAVYLIHIVPLVILAFAAYRWDVYDLLRRGRSIYFALSVCLALSGLLASLMIFHPMSAVPPDGRLSVEFLDVGQGDAAFVTFPNGSTMLIDGGGRVNFSGSDDEERPFEPDVPRIGEMVVSEFLWEKGLSQIDRIVVTHADADHAQGLTDVVRNFSVGEIWLGALPKGGSELDELLAEAKRKNIPVVQVGRGDAFEIGGTKIETLWPIRTGEQKGSDNNASLVLRLTYGEREFLFTGDIEKETEAALLASGTLHSADVLKVPHHGSRTSSTAEFVNAVRPQIAIIPVGRRSMFGHPHPDVLERWKAASPIVLTTGQNGAITIITDGLSIALSSFVR